jgi:hypothetical protein
MDEEIWVRGSLILLDFTQWLYQHSFIRIVLIKDGIKCDKSTVRLHCACKQLTLLQRDNLQRERGFNRQSLIYLSYNATLLLALPRVSEV